MFFKFSEKIKNAEKKALELCEISFEKIEKIAEFNGQKMLKAFIDCEVSESHFSGTTGYGYNDRGREVLEKVFAKIFGAEDSLVRHNLMSGTHALTVALFGILRPNDKILSVTGKPYDTMRKVISGGAGSLKDFNIEFKYIDYNFDEEDFLKEIEKNLNMETFKMVYIQRSRGYTLRESISTEKIKKISETVNKISPKTVILVDNCYGEFVQTQEPTEVGADLAVGSLIKNPGGGIARTGGYIVGKKYLVDLCAQRLTVPGIGKEIGSTLNLNRELFMGIFNAPHIVEQALKTAVFTSALFEILGFETFPKYSLERFDITQAIKLNTSENLIDFCRGIQKFSPIDSFVAPEAWDMPGYNDKIIMAAGTFTNGSSIEISADAPLCEPFAVWLQGGITFISAKIAVLGAANIITKDQ